jgi:hypothetical protein
VVDESDKETGRYSTALEFPVPATVVTIELVALPIVLAVSVADVYPPKSEKIKSVSASVETAPTDGLEDVALHAFAPFGSVAKGSNGVVVSAPDTPKEIPEADIGVVESWTVIVSDVTAEGAIPYHSMRLDF